MMRVAGQVPGDMSILKWLRVAPGAQMAGLIVVSAA
jgi:hypothetical protein